MRECEFRENWRNENRALLRDIDEPFSAPSTLTVRCGLPLGIRSPHIVLLRIWNVVEIGTEKVVLLCYMTYDIIRMYR